MDNFDIDKGRWYYTMRFDIVEGRCEIWHRIKIYYKKIRGFDESGTKGSGDLWEVVRKGSKTKGNGDEGRWWRRECVIFGNGDEGKRWRREMVMKGSGD